MFKLSISNKYRTYIPSTPNHSSTTATLNKETLEKLIDRRVKIVDIAAMFNTSPQNIYAYMKKFGLQSLLKKTAISYSEFVKYVNEGKTAPEIAKILNISKTRVHYFAKKHGLKFITRQQKAETKIDTKKLIEYLQQNKTVKEIARLFHVATNRIYEHIEQYQIPFVKWKKVITDQQKDLQEKIVLLMNKGCTLEQISQKTGLGKPQISKIISDVTGKGFIKSRNELIVDMLKNGIDINEIAQKFHLSATTVHTMKQKLHIEKPLSLKTLQRRKEIHDEVISLWKSGLSIQEIAIKLHKSVGTIYKYLRNP